MEEGGESGFKVDASEGTEPMPVERDPAAIEAAAAATTPS